jgi:putative hydrolase of the HAD superfamily
MTLKLHRPERFEALPAAVLLDSDNTLYPYRPAHEAALAATRAKATNVLSIQPQQFDEGYARAREAVKARLGATASSHSRLLYFQRLLELLGLNTQVLLALDLEQTYWRTYLSNARLFEGVTEFLDDLRINGIPTAVVTDLTAQIQFRKIVYLGLDHYLDYVVTSEEAGRDKPDRAPFQLAVDKLQAGDGATWMIGDDPLTDVKGARETIDAVTLQKRHGGVVVGDGEARADLVFDDFAELRRLFKRLAQGGT